MKIIINGKPYCIDKPLSIKELALMFNISYDIVVINSYPLNHDYIVNENDEISLIKKGVIPSYDELEFLMASRHGLEIHSKLKKSSIVIAGLGGLGSNIAINLARIGVGRIKIIDFDIVEPSNLNRQQYNINQIGMKKVDALEENINNINPFISLEKADVYISKDNIYELFNGFDVIIEAFDNPVCKKMLIEECLTLFPNSFIIGASGVAGFFSTDLVKKKRIGKNCLIIGDFENEAGTYMGLMAPRVAAIANIQANEAVRYLLGDYNDKSNS